MRPEAVEITDLLGGRDRPVRRVDVVERLRASGQRRAARIAERLPATPDGLLDRAEVERLIVRVHRELQRLSEELQQGRRIAETLAPWVARLGGGDRPVRVVDVGCGLGYVVRWLAAHRALEGVELVGVDLDSGLVEEAARLAAVEGLDCGFVHGDALAPGVAVRDPGRTLVISTGLIDHRRDDLRGCLRGLFVLGCCSLPVLGLFLLDRDLARTDAWGAAAEAMLPVYLPYAALVLLALLAFATLHWRRRFLAMAVILGPFTFARPLVAVVGGGVLGVLAAGDRAAGYGVVAAVLAVLAVEPVCDRWYARSPR